MGHERLRRRLRQDLQNTASANPVGLICLHVCRIVLFLVLFPAHIGETKVQKMAYEKAAAKLEKTREGGECVWKEVACGAMQRRTTVALEHRSL